MHNKSFAPLLIFLPIWLLFSVLGTAADSQANQSADSLYHQASSLLASGDTSRATAVLDSVLEQDKKHYEALLMRGRLYLAAGDKKNAKLTFRDALFSKSAFIHCQAHIGLGDIEASFPRRKAQAIQCYRKAIQQNPGSLEAHYKLARVSLAMDTHEGAERAIDELLDILCLDPTYLNANLIWRDSVKIRYAKDMRRAAECLESTIPNHPGNDSLLLDAASYHFQGEQADRALPLLDRLANVAPGHRPASRHLLRARCLAELDDTTGFQTAYDSALASAEQTGDFSELVSQAAAIFRPEEQLKADSLDSAQQWATFFRVFWSRRDPDPLTAVNERLFEHYRRLREARRKYMIPNPYVRAHRSKTFYKLLNFGPTMRGYDYKPGLLWERNRDLLLEQRGLLYIRHGPPDEIEKPGSGYYDSNGILRLREGPPEEAEVWRYGSIYFPFKYTHLSGGQYFYLPLPVRGIGNLTKAMDKESFKDPLPKLETDCYSVCFKAPGDEIELETYQSVRVEESGMSSPPGISQAVFDNSWKELARDSSLAIKADLPSGVAWVGANRVITSSGKLFCVSRLDIPGMRAVKRHGITPKAFRGRGLEMSGVVLGSPVPPTGGTHNRLGVELLPRPSLTYWAGEIMTVYLELYGLRSGNDSEKSYSVSVTITRTKEDSGVFGKVGRLFSSGGQERASSLTLSFERQRPEGGQSLAENFTVDTSLLLPGEYRMAIEVADRNSRARRKVGCSFKLVEPE